MKPMLPSLQLQFRRGGQQLIGVDEQLGELAEFGRSLCAFSPLWARWYLASTTSRQAALQQLAFDATGPHPGAATAIATAQGSATDLRSIALWNGAASEADGATLRSMTCAGSRPDSIEFSWAEHPALADWTQAAAFVTAAVRVWPARFARLAPFWHANQRIFKDRPGVGWMIYLPQPLGPRELPEAATLVPIQGRGGQPLGTLVVSVIDAPFSDDNPTHLAAALAIEVRLVDLDLLPRYIDI